MIKLSEVRENVWLVEFKSRREMAMTFLRFQEFYESPRFAGKVFTHREFRKWYSADRGAFTYVSDWSGFNLPGWIIKAFAHGLFNPLTKEEQRLVDLLRHKPEPFYVLGTMAGDSDTLDHEIAHALFYLKPVYRATVRDLMARYEKHLVPVRKRLRAMGYGEDVLLDESHAYLMFDQDELRIAKGQAENLEALSESLKNLFSSWCASMQAQR